MAPHEHAADRSPALLVATFARRARGPTRACLETFRVARGLPMDPTPRSHAWIAFGRGSSIQAWSGVPEANRERTLSGSVGVRHHQTRGLATNTGPIYKDESARPTRRCREMRQRGNLLGKNQSTRCVGYTCSTRNPGPAHTRAKLQRIAAGVAAGMVPVALARPEVGARRVVLWCDGFKAIRSAAMDGVFPFAKSSHARSSHTRRRHARVLESMGTPPAAWRIRAGRPDPDARGRTGMAAAFSRPGTVRGAGVHSSRHRGCWRSSLTRRDRHVYEGARFTSSASKSTATAGGLRLVRRASRSGGAGTDAALDYIFECRTTRVRR